MTKSRIVERGIPDFKDRSGNWVGSYTVDYKQSTTLALETWCRMMTRCKLKTGPYRDVTSGFKDFQEFADWCQSQYGYGFKDEYERFWQLDKDILVPNNKIYSPSSCIFVPGRVNNLLLLSKGIVNKYPIGVCFDKEKGKFKSDCNSNDGSKRKKHLGYYSNPIEAHKAWQKYKITVFDKIILENDIKGHTRLTTALKKIRDKIEYDYSNDLETTSYFR